MGFLSKKNDKVEILKRNLNPGIKCQIFVFLAIFSKTGHQMFLILCMMVEGKEIGALIGV